MPSLKAWEQGSGAPAHRQVVQGPHGACQLHHAGIAKRVLMDHQLCQPPAQRQYDRQRLDLRVAPLELAKVELVHASHHLKDGLAELGRHDRIAVGAVGVGLVAVLVAAKECERLRQRRAGECSLCVALLAEIDHLRPVLQG